MIDYIEKNEMRLLSHIIYTIYNTADIRKMRTEVLNLVNYEVPFSTANFFLAIKDSSGEYTLGDCINVNHLENDKGLSEVIRKYVATCSDIDATHWLCNTNNPIAYRLTDFFSESSLKDSIYYKEMLEPYNVHYAAQLVLAHNNIFVGLLTLFRSKDSPNFTDNEIFFLDTLKEHLSIRLYQLQMQSSSQNHDLSSYRERYDLTNREYQILLLLYSGQSEEAIVDMLCISKNTLRRHFYNLYNKLNIKHRWELHFMHQQV